MKTIELNDITYDVSKLSTEGQGVFSVLSILREDIASAKTKLVILSAAQARILEVMETHLMDEAIVLPNDEE
jgi:hypothetical protein|tara:strand:+ start:44 stop:259 length:216 start_codon:yes stop_codon:yes gene_type:complete